MEIEEKDHPLTSGEVAYLVKKYMGRAGIQKKKLSPPFGDWGSRGLHA